MSARAFGGRRWLRSLVAAVLAVPAPAPARAAEAPRPLEIHWVDVEGGAATLIVTPAGESILVDTGWPGPRDADRIRAAAARAGLTRVDHLVTTHWHQDHFGGVAEVAGRLPIGRFYDHGFPEGAPPDIRPDLKEAYLRITRGGATVLQAGDRIELRPAGGSPPLSLRVVASQGRVTGEPAGAPQTRPCEAHPARPDDPSDNYRSLGFVLSFGGFDLLDLGDLTWNVEHKLACPKNLLGAVDVYQVTHHGADDSNHPAVLQAVAPTMAVVNNGPKKGGKAEVFQRLKAVASIRDVFQVHRNVQTAPADNAPAAFVANAAEACQGEWVRLVVDPSAKTYTVEVPAKGTRRTYAVR